MVLIILFTYVNHALLNVVTLMKTKMCKRKKPENKGISTFN